MRYMLLLFLAACSSTPHMLADGAPLAPVEPRVTYTPAGAGLPPEYWGTPEAPKVERSPHKRVLPQTPDTMKEPGIWASSTPPDSKPVLLDDAYLPLPPDGNPTYRNMCAQQMSLALMVTDRAALRRKIDSLRHQCMAARLWAECMDGLVERMRATADEVVMERVEASRAFAAENAKRSCMGTGSGPDRDVDDLVHKAAEAWKRFPRR